MGAGDLALSGDYLLGPDEALRRQEAALQGCTRCKLCQARNTIVFGSGNPRAELIVIGEGPGADEDAQGLPFVGRAGQLLTKMLDSVQISRDEIYITNTVKCFISPRVLIYTAEGYRPIKDIKIDDLVLTHLGRFRKVVYIRPYEVLPKNNEVIRFTVRGTTGNTRPIKMTVTPEHPFHVTGSWKPASELQPGERLLVLGDRCEVCTNLFFARYDRYDARAWHTCSRRCHSQRVFHGPEAREKIRLTMRQQYQDGRRDARTIALRANEVTRQLVAAGAARLQRLTAGERHRSRVAVAQNITAGRSRGMIGFGEAELKVILDRLDVRYVHLFALPESAFLFDFCLPDEKILIEVRGPGFAAGAVPHERALIKEGLAAEHGYLVINLWWAQILHQPSMVEDLLRRVLRNHSGDYSFVEAVVVDVVRYRTTQHFRLYNIGVEEDESYIADGIVSHNCRPPGNRNPEADELAACAPILAAQFAALQPKVVLSLGAVATQALLGTKEAIGKLRGRIHPYGSAVLIPTFHPAFLLRNPGQEYKRMAWDDLKLAKREYDQRRTR